MHNKEIWQYIGAKIREEREKRQLTIEELAEILNIAPGFLGLIERGQRGTRLKNLFKIATFFGLSMDQLTGFNTIKNNDDNEGLNEYEETFFRFSSIAKVLNTNDLNYFIGCIKSYNSTKKINGL